MKQIQPTRNTHSWPRSKVQSVECRKQDLVIRISDWLKDPDEPAYDVEVYIGGVYDWNESRSFTLWTELGPRTCSKERAKELAVEFAQKQLAKLL